MGSLTLTTISDFPHTYPASPTISAPASWYSASRNPDSAPAWVSTSTKCPASVSAFTPAGVTPTRASLSLISLGTPMIMICSCQLDAGRRRPGSEENCHLLRVVDLRPLQLVGVIDIHRFPRREEVNRPIALAMAIPCVLHPAKRQMNLRADGGSIDV